MCVSLIVFCTDFVHKRDGVILEERLDFSSIRRLDVTCEVDPGLVEPAIEHQGRRFNTCILDGSLVDGVAEEVVVAMLLGSGGEFRSWRLCGRGKVKNCD